MYLDMVDGNSALEEFACIWQSKWVGSDGDFISNWKFPDCMHFFGEWTGQVWWDNSRHIQTHEKSAAETVHRLGTIIQIIFYAQSRASIRLIRLEMVQWESVPRGSSARAWKLSSRLFSRPDWLHLGLWGWGYSELKSATSPTNNDCWLFDNSHLLIIGKLGIDLVFLFNYISGSTDLNIDRFVTFVSHDRSRFQNPALINVETCQLYVKPLLFRPLLLMGL